VPPPTGDILPDIPPIGDFVPGYEASSWDGIGAPVGTPREIITILNREVNAALVDPTFKAKLADLGAEPFANSPAEFPKFIAEFTEGGHRGTVGSIRLSSDTP
jgi:tripartite-type tricarboxylate transporter receptor subunit TctC